MKFENRLHEKISKFDSWSEKYHEINRLREENHKFRHFIAGKMQNRCIIN